jgi:hypothetical protein
MVTNYWISISGEKIQPFLHLINCYQCSTYTKFTPDHEIPLAIGLLKGISWVSTHYKSYLLLYINMTCIQITGVILVAKKLLPMFHDSVSYQCSSYTKLTPDHEIPLAVGLLKGISWVSTHYITGLLLIK